MKETHTWLLLSSDPVVPCVRFTRWEEKQLQIARARTIFERALNELADAEKTEKLYMAFANFEEKCAPSLPSPIDLILYPCHSHTCPLASSFL